MKNSFRVMAACMAMMLMVFTSCHKEGCPGKITKIDTETTQNV